MPDSGAQRSSNACRPTATGWRAHRAAARLLPARARACPTPPTRCSTSATPSGRSSTTSPSCTPSTAWCSISPPAATCAARPAALERVVTNLVANAAKYSPAGTTITVTVASREVDSPAVVDDEGSGVPVERPGAASSAGSTAAAATPSPAPAAPASGSPSSPSTRRRCPASPASAPHPAAAPGSRHLPARSARSQAAVAGRPQEQPMSRFRDQLVPLVAGAGRVVVAASVVLLLRAPTARASTR